MAKNVIACLFSCSIHIPNLANFLGLLAKYFEVHGPVRPSPLKNHSGICKDSKRFIKQKGRVISAPAFSDWWISTSIFVMMRDCSIIN
jgi:hypothetical protein